MSIGTRIARRLHGCPSQAALSRAFSEGAAPTLSLHVRGCVHCHEDWGAMERVRDAAALLPATSLDADVKNRLASRIVAAAREESAPRASGSRWRWVPVLAAGATVALVIAVGKRLPEHGPSSASAPRSAIAVHAKGAVAFSRMRPPPDELLRLDDGTLSLDVTALGPNQRVRVATADTELELGEGKFDVTAAGRRLTAVRVRYGHTVLRGERFEVRLTDGDQWTPSGPTIGATGRVPARGSAATETSGERQRLSAVGPIPSVRSAKTVRVPSDAASGGTSPSKPQVVSIASSGSIGPAALARASAAIPHTPPVPAGTPAQRASFDRGWRLLRARDAGQAASAFAEVSNESLGGAIREDALFWRGVALARAALPRDARTTFSEFVQIYPSSPRRGEAAAMLGWLCLDAHDTSAAQVAFGLARNDRTDRVRASALCGLARLAGEPCREEPGP